MEGFGESLINMSTLSKSIWKDYAQGVLNSFPPFRTTDLSCSSLLGSSVKCLAYLNSWNSWSTTSIFSPSFTFLPLNLGMCGVLMQFLPCPLGYSHCRKTKRFAPTLSKDQPWLVQAFPSIWQFGISLNALCPFTRAMVSFEMLQSPGRSSSSLIGQPSLCLLLLWCPAEELPCPAHGGGSVSMDTPL